MSVSGILDIWCYMYDTVPEAVVFSMPFLACTDPTINWQAKAAYFNNCIVFGTWSLHAE